MALVNDVTSTQAAEKKFFRQPQIGHLVAHEGGGGTYVVSREAGADICRGHFWQPGGGHDRNLWGTTAIHNEVDYIHANPVRRGLCGRPEDWRYSSAGFYAGLVDVPLQIAPTLPPRP